MRKIAITLLAKIALSGMLAGCGSQQGGANNPADTANATVIDVRTPAEFATGHLQGAVNIDVTAANFVAKITALPKDSTYLLYCRSGSRAGQARTIMLQQGFTDVTNLGSLQAASSATGLPIVTQ